MSKERWFKYLNADEQSQIKSMKFELLATKSAMYLVLIAYILLINISIFGGFAKLSDDYLIGSLMVVNGIVLLLGIFGSIQKLGKHTEKVEKGIEALKNTGKKRDNETYFSSKFTKQN